MQKTLAALLDLQNVDDKLDELREERGDLPTIVEELNSKINKEKEDFNQLQVEIEDSKKRILEIDVQLAEFNDKLKKYNEQLYQVKTNREYDAMTIEIDAVQQKILEIENEKKQLISGNEQKTAIIEDLESELVNLEKELKENKVELDEKLSETKEEEDALLKQRKKIVSQFSPNIIKTYEKIRNARDGKGIVPITNGHCGGCYAYIPPQRVVEVRKMKNIYECESCGRILVWVE